VEERQQSDVEYKDLIFKERLARKLVEQYVGPYNIEEVISTNAVNVKIARSRLSFSYFLFSFLFYFQFIFLYFIFRTRIRVRVTRLHCHKAGHIR